MNKNILKMALSAMLIAIGILIPIVSPIKVIIEPMSFTLASHVAIMIAVFVSPSVAVAAALGTTLGFLLYGFPMPVVLRALSHVVWAFAAAYYLKKHSETLNSIVKTVVFVLAVGVIHAICEVLVVLPMYLGTLDTNEFIYMVVGLVGLGTVVHSSVDFIISIAIWKIICKSREVSAISSVKEVQLKLRSNEA